MFVVACPVTVAVEPVCWPQTGDLSRFRTSINSSSIWLVKDKGEQDLWCERRKKERRKKKKIT